MQFCGTKANHVCTIYDMLEDGFIASRPTFVCATGLTLNFFCGTMTKHVVVADRMLDGGFVTKASVVAHLFIRNAQNTMDTRRTP